MNWKRAHPHPHRSSEQSKWKHLAVKGGSNCEIVHLVKHLNKSVVALQTAIIFIYSRRSCRVVNRDNEKTKHRSKQRCIWKLNDVVSKNRACVCAARHLSRPEMSPGFPFATINIFYTLRLGVVASFFSFMDGIVGPGRAVVAELQLKWLAENMCVLKEVAFRSMCVGTDFLQMNQ